MVRVINPYATERPIGQMIAQIGQQLFGDQAGAQLAREQAYAASRANAETDNLMRWAATGQNLNNLSPEAAAMLIGSGYDPNDLGRIGSLYASTNLGPRAPETTGWLTGLGEYRNTPEAFDLDLAEVARANDMASADRRYGVDQNVAEDARQFNMTPTEALVNGQPAFVPRSGAFDAGVAPVLSETDVLGTELQRLFPTLTPEQQRTAVGAAPSLDQVRAGVATEALGTEAGLGGLDPNTQAFVGADVNEGARTPRTYLTPNGEVGTTFDGLHDAMTGEVLPQGTIPYNSTLQATDTGGLAPSARGRMDELEFSYVQLDDLATQLLTAIDQTDPRNFGLSGAIANTARGAVAAISNVAGLVGIEGLDANTLRQQVTTMPTDPNDPVQPGTWDLIFSPAATELQTLGGIFLWRAASALAGQGGRELSNADMTRVINQFGSPTSWGTDQVNYRQKIAAIQSYVRTQIDLIRGLRDREPINWTGGGNAINPAGSPAPIVAPAPNLTPNPDGTFTWTPTP